MGQLEFYLEALDRDVKLPHENPSVGLILCASKDDAVVEYAIKLCWKASCVISPRLSRRKTSRTKTNKIPPTACLSCGGRVAIL